MSMAERSGAGLSAAEQREVVEVYPGMKYRIYTWLPNAKAHSPLGSVLLGWGKRWLAYKDSNPDNIQFLGEHDSREEAVDAVWKAR